MKLLGDIMKQYEQKYELKIKPNEYFIIRLDGCSFSKYTKKFNKPFDNNFSNAMISTMNDLVTKFSAQTGYTHSDEISLVFDKINTLIDNNNHIYNGRIIKICTIIASYCSLRFNYHIDNLIKKTDIKIELNTACFDARILTFDENNKYELCNYFI